MLKSPTNAFTEQGKEPTITKNLLPWPKSTLPHFIIALRFLEVYAQLGVLVVVRDVGSGKQVVSTGWGQQKARPRGNAGGSTHSKRDGQMQV